MIRADEVIALEVACEEPCNDSPLYDLCIGRRHVQFRSNSTAASEAKTDFLSGSHRSVKTMAKPRAKIPLEQPKTAEKSVQQQIMDDLIVESTAPRLKTEEQLTKTEEKEETEEVKKTEKGEEVKKTEKGEEAVTTGKEQKDKVAEEDEEGKQEGKIIVEREEKESRGSPTSKTEMVTCDRAESPQSLLSNLPVTEESEASEGVHASRLQPDLSLGENICIYFQQDGKLTKIQLSKLTAANRISRIVKFVSPPEQDAESGIF